MGNYQIIGYCQKQPQFFEKDIFKIVISTVNIDTPQATPQATPQVGSDKISKVLAFCIEPKTREEIQQFLGLKDREHFRLEILKPLIEKGLLLMSIPDKPNSPKQKYYSVKNKDKKLKSKIK